MLGLWLACALLTSLAFVAARVSATAPPKMNFRYLMFAGLLLFAAVSVYDAIQRAIFP